MNTSGYYNRRQSRDQDREMASRLAQFERLQIVASHDYGVDNETHDASQDIVRGVQPQVFGQQPKVDLYAGVVRYGTELPPHEQGHIIWNFGHRGFSVMYMHPQVSEEVHPVVFELDFDDKGTVSQSRPAKPATVAAVRALMNETFEALDDLYLHS